MGRPEAYVEDYLRKRSKQKEWLCYKWVSPGRSGVPDDIVITDTGLVVFVECKSATGKLSELQKLTIGKLRDHGADVRVVYTREEVDELFEELEEKGKRKRKKE